MPHKPSLHAELDWLRQVAAAEKVKLRDAEVKLEVVKSKAEEASQALTSAYAMGSQGAITEAREREQAVIAELEDLEHRLQGAELRVQSAQAEADRFERDNARSLLDERAGGARTLAADLTRAVAEVVRLNRSYQAERSLVDRLLAAAGFEPRSDGPPASHAWESELRDLERAVRQHPAVDAPTPRWFGMRHRRAEDENARRLGRKAGIL
jgi:chromosome segregation ATPase